MNKFLVVVFAILVVAGIGVLLFNQPKITPPPALPVSHPLIRIESPLAGEVIKSPFLIKGEARGNWFFEGSFPVKLVDALGKNIPINPPYVMTTAEWMTTDFVPFETIHTFAPPATATGTLIIMKDNPSGLLENDDQVEIPVRFEETPAPPTDPIAGKSCFISGCSGQVCTDQEIFTTCEWLPEYACYWTAICERQADGECGWTHTPELLSCLARNQ